MDDLQKLLAIQAIYNLKARYFRCMDMKDWAGLEATFAEDVVADFRESTNDRSEGMLVEGAATYVAQLAPILETITTVHHGHMPEIEITSETTASGIWAMEDKLWTKDGSPMPWRHMHGYGHYHEDYVKVNGEWRIKAIQLSRLRVDIAGES